MPTNIKPEDVVVEATSIETTIEDHKIKGTEGTKVQLIDPKGNCSTGDAESDTHASKSGDDTSGTPDDESVSSVNTADIMVGVDELSSNKPVSDGSNVGTDASEHSANVTNSRTAEGTSEAKDTHTPDVNNTESNSDEGGYVLAKYSISDKNLPDVEGSASSGSEKREGLCDAPEDQLETVNDITANSDMAGISGTEQPEKTILPSDKDLEEFVSHSNTNTIEHTDDNEGGNANAPIANMPTAEDTDEGVSSAATSSSTAKVVSSGADSNSTTTDAYSAKSGTTTTSGQGDISATPARTMIIRPIVKATVILGIRVGSGTGDEHTVYKTLVEKATGDRYVILKRYSDFYKLRADIVNSIEAQPVAVRGIIGHALMAFPEKKMFNNKTDEVVQERILRLNGFLSFLIEELPSNMDTEKLICDFLEPEDDSATLNAIARTSLPDNSDVIDKRLRTGLTQTPGAEVQMKMLPLWLYLFNPWTQTADQLEGEKRLPFGRVYVHVVGASGLIASDFAVFSQASSDPYCVLECGNIEKEKAQTHRIQATVNPHWDEEFAMNVWRPNAQLTLKVYDYDTATSDDHIGEVQIPIEMLRDGKLHDVWFDLHPEPGKRDSNMRDEGNMGRIRVRMQYKYSAMGEYLAHFMKPEAKELEDFEVNKTYGYAMQCYELLLPLIGYAQRAVKVLVWEPPLLTWLCYMAFTFVCFNPRFFIPIMHLPLIGVLVKKGWYRYLITQYTKYGTVGLYGRKYMGPLPSAKEVGLMDEFTYELDSGGEESDEERAIPAAGPPTDNEPLDPAVYGANGVKPSTVEDDLASLGALGTAIGALVAVVPGVQQYLDKAQNGIVSANDGIESLYAVFDWSNTTVSRDALIGLILSAFVFCFIELHLIVFAAGTAILFCTSDVGQKIIKFVSGVAKYLTTRRYKKMESSGSVHADADIQNNIYRAMRRRTKRLTVNRETTKSANVYLATNTRTPTQNAIVSPKSAVVKPPKAASVM